MSKSLLQDHQNLPHGNCKSRTSKQLEIDYTHKDQNAKNRFWCGACPRKYFRNSSDRATHLRLLHHACSTCLQVFPNSAARQAHQKSAVHCYCPECDGDGKAFLTLEQLAKHECTGTHGDKYECIVCKANFSNGTAFEHHFNSENHAPHSNAKAKKLYEADFVACQHARVEVSNLWCEQCKKHFVDSAAYKQHKDSSKHKAPVVAVDCGCDKKFTLLSAFVQHLESGGCSSGMNREHLNRVIYNYDPDRRITKAEYADRFASSSIAGSSTASIAPEDWASTLGFSFRNMSVESSRSKMVRDRTFTPDDSDATSTVSMQSGVLLTPEGSEHTSTDSGSIPTPPGSDIGRDRVVRNKFFVPRDSDHATTDSKFIATPSASDTSDTSSDDGVVLTPSATSGGSISARSSSTAASSDSGGADILTPPGSLNAGASDEWSFVSSPTIFTPDSTSIDGSSVATIRYDAVSKTWPCSECSRTFTLRKDLSQHMASAVHAPEIFHCPTSGPDCESDREFSTMSGLFQHIEGGLCNAGNEALNTVLGVIKEPMQKKSKAKITSLE